MEADLDPLGMSQSLRSIANNDKQGTYGEVHSYTQI